mgnify:FL=1
MPCSLLPLCHPPGPVQVAIDKRPRDHMTLSQDGPLVLAFFFASPAGRWRSELLGVSKDARQALAKLEEVLASQRRALRDDAKKEGLVGICLLRGWRFCLGVSENSAVLLFKRAVAAGHKRAKDYGFLEHPLVASCMFLEGHDLQVQSSWLTLPGKVGGAHLLNAIDGAFQAYETFSEGYGVLPKPRPVLDILHKWLREHGDVHGGSYLWPVWSPIALATCLGLWPADLSLLLKRHHGQDIKAPSQPSRMQTREFLSPCHATDRAACLVMVDDVPCASSSWRTRKYSAKDMILAVAATKDLSNQSKAVANSEAWMRFWHGDKADHVMATLGQSGNNCHPDTS